MTTLNYKDIIDAHSLIKPYILKTPLIKAHALSDKLKANVYLKLENIQVTSSFKTRGAFHKILKLSQSEQQQANNQ